MKLAIGTQVKFKSNRPGSNTWYQGTLVEAGDEVVDSITGEKESGYWIDTGTLPWTWVPTTDIRRA